MTSYNPGVEVQEIDVSQIISSSMDITIACYAGNFSKGPIDSYIVIPTVELFISVYGYPNFINYNDWYQVYNYLSYGSGIIAVCRIGGTDTEFAIDQNLYNIPESTFTTFQFLSGSHLTPKIEADSGSEQFNAGLSVNSLDVTTTITELLLDSGSEQFNAGLSVNSLDVTSTPNTSLTLALLHFDAIAGSYDFRDSSQYNLTYSPSYSNNTISDAKSRFGGTSLYSGNDPGSGVEAHDAIFNFGNSNFTLEGYYNPDDISGYRGYCNVGRRNGIFSVNGVLKAQVQFGSNTFEITHQNAISAGTWTHLALVRIGSQIYLYNNGVKSSTYISVGTNSLDFYMNSFGASMSQVFIDAHTGYTWASGANGHIDECRLRLEAVYTGNFTPPSAPFTY